MGDDQMEKMTTEFGWSGPDMECGLEDAYTKLGSWFKGEFFRRMRDKKAS